MSNNTDYSSIGRLQLEEEHKQMFNNLNNTQARCNELLEENRNFKLSDLNYLRDDAKETAIAHGFTEASVGEDIALMHSELSEALEDYRAGKPVDVVSYTDKGKPIGLPTEMADVIIRILHFCGKHNIDIKKVVLEKIAYNKTRSFKHGNKKI
jgi:hypothetical protein